MKAESALSLLTELLTDLRQIQLQLVRWLPAVAARVTHPGLRHLIGKHAAESAAHLERLEHFFALHNIRPVEGISKAIKLIIDDSDESIPDLGDPDRSDLVLMIQMMRVEQFEITSYEIVARVAEQLGFADDTEVLLEFLAERDMAASILRDLQSEMIKNAFPTEIRPDPLFSD
jgi:ferritin-like metal-binding protein YciE